jgi:hypothetical protein
MARPSSARITARRGRDEDDPAIAGLAQLDRYLDRLGLDTGVLAVFDARLKLPPLPERTSITIETSPAGRGITVFRGLSGCSHRGMICTYRNAVYRCG